MSIQANKTVGKTNLPISVETDTCTYQHWQRGGSKYVGPMLVSLHAPEVPEYYDVVGRDTTNRARLSDAWKYSSCCFGNYGRCHCFQSYPSMVNCIRLQRSENSAFEPYRKTSTALSPPSEGSELSTEQEDPQTRAVLKEAYQKEIKGKGETRCTVCNKLFSRTCTLKVHMRIHRGEKPYRCPYCHKCFSQSGNRAVHIRTHTGERPYGCIECGKSFRQSSALRSHLLIHKRNTKGLGYVF